MFFYQQSSDNAWRPNITYSLSKIYSVYSAFVNSSGHYSKQGRCSFYISPQRHFHFVWLGPEFQRETENVLLFFSKEVNEDHVSSSINFCLLFISLVLSCSFMVCLLNVLQKFSLSSFMSLGKKQSDILQILC